MFDDQRFLIFFSYIENMNVMELLVFNNLLVKQVTSQIERKSIEDRSSFQQTKGEITELILLNLTGSFYAEDKAKVLELTSKNDAILKKE